MLKLDGCTEDKIENVEVRIKPYWNHTTNPSIPENIFMLNFNYHMVHEQVFDAPLQKVLDAVYKQGILQGRANKINDIKMALELE